MLLVFSNFVMTIFEIGEEYKAMNDVKEAIEILCEKGDGSRTVGIFLPEGDPVSKEYFIIKIKKERYLSINENNFIILYYGKKEMKRKAIDCPLYMDIVGYDMKEFYISGQDAGEYKYLEVEYLTEPKNTIRITE